MEHAILKKKLNTFKSEKGSLRRVSNEVALEVLREWENWPGKAVELYRALGLSKMQLVVMIQKAKRLVKRGVVTESEFKEINLSELPGQVSKVGTGSYNIELMWGKEKVIRFVEVSQLVEFLKKAA